MDYVIIGHVLIGVLLWARMRALDHGKEVGYAQGYKAASDEWRSKYTDLVLAKAEQQR
jgi:hypothetical protein